MTPESGGASLLNGKYIRGMLAAACFSMFPLQSAHANEVHNVKSLDLDVRGHISQHCMLGNLAGVDFGDLRRSNLSAAVTASLICNVPFDLSIKAQNGALVNSELPNGQGPYSGRLGYSLAVDLPVRRPQNEMVSRTFDSQALLGGQYLSSAGGIAVDGIALRLSLAPPSGEAGLLAGAYGEVIEITITPT